MQSGLRGLTSAHSGAWFEHLVVVPHSNDSPRLTPCSWTCIAEAPGMAGTQHRVPRTAWMVRNRGSRRGSPGERGARMGTDEETGAICWSAHPQPFRPHHITTLSSNHSSKMHTRETNPVGRSKHPSIPLLTHAYLISLPLLAVEKSWGSPCTRAQKHRSKGRSNPTKVDDGQHGHPPPLRKKPHP